MSASPWPSLRYAKSTGWLLMPVLLWNVALSSRLPPAFSPQVFSFNIPVVLSVAENSLRVMVFVLPFLTPFELIARSQKIGMAVFGLGLAIYFASWLPLISFPESMWSHSAAGFLAPAYTPLIWLFGLALLMQRLHWQSPYPRRPPKVLHLWPPKLPHLVGVN